MKKRRDSKQQDLRKYAPLGLWLALAAFLATGILGLIKIFVLVGIYVPPNDKAVNLSLWISLGLIVVGLATYILLNPQRVREFIAGRQARYGSNAVIMLIAFIGILVTANIIVYYNPDQWDLTQDKQHTLAPETIYTLQSLPSPVMATALYSSRMPTGSAESLLADYKMNSDGKFDYEFVDPELEPLKARELLQQEAIRDGTIVLKMGDRHEVVMYATEEEMTNALVRLINPGERTVYFLTGHGEHDIQGSDKTAYTTVRQTLETKNYTVQSLSLRGAAAVPADALAIIIAGPMYPITNEEMTLLEAYVAGGGSLIIMEEPLPLTEYGGAPDPLASYLIKTWGIIMHNNIVIDPNTQPPIGASADPIGYANHPITQNLRGLYTVFPWSRSLEISEPPADVQATALVHTTSSAWGETDINSIANNQIAFDEGQDLAGPVILVVAAENATTGGRVVVFGDSEFAMDNYYATYANGDLIINTIDWAAKQESLIDLTYSPPVLRQFAPMHSYTLILIGAAFVCIIPGLIVAGGIAAWLARRARG